MSWLDRFTGPERARQRALRQVRPGPLHDLLAQPWPERTRLARNARLIALDIEATGLDPIKDHIVSIGLVEIVDMAVLLETALYQVLRADTPMPQDSAVIHQITDDRCRAGLPLAQVIPEILQRLQGGILLAHHAWVEQGFLSTACQRLYGAPLVVPTIDTQALAQRLMRNRNQFVAGTSLRLFNLRSYYRLPRYRAHNALSDALATAELFLALAADIQPDGDLRLGQVLMH